MLKGLPGSGKSTYAKQRVESWRDTVRVNKDELRKMLFANSKRRDWHEKVVISVRDNIIIAALAHGKNVVVDDTNFNPIHEKRLREIAEAANAEFSILELGTHLHECIANDLRRADSVGETVIRDMHNKYVRPTLHVEQNPELEGAVIFDLDGTLADIGDRNPYDASTCEYDKVKYAVYDNLMRYKANGYKIVVCSGRSEKYLTETDRWLGKHGIEPDLFLMRKLDDNRKDYVVKYEMFMKEILPRFYVEAAFDDRQQVIDLWRDLGITAFQVADGRF